MGKVEPFTNKGKTLATTVDGEIEVANSTSEYIALLVVKLNELITAHNEHIESCGGMHVHKWRECYPILGERYEWCDTKGCGIWRGGKSPWEATQQPQERNI